MTYRLLVPANNTFGKTSRKNMTPAKMSFLFFIIQEQVKVINIIRINIFRYLFTVCQFLYSFFKIISQFICRQPLTIRLTQCSIKSLNQYLCEYSVLPLVI